MSNYKLIILNASNKDKIENILTEVQKNASVRLFDVNDIFSFVGEILKYKERYALTWEELECCKFYFDTYETMPNSYKYKVSYTGIEIVVQNGKCRLSKIFRDTDFCNRYNAHRSQVYGLSDMAKEKILNNSIYL